MITPELQREFDASRREQGQYVMVGHINANVRETTRVAIRVLDQLAHRGVAMAECEDRAHTLEQSSRQFVVQVTPWWRRCLPQLWWCPYGS